MCKDNAPKGGKKVTVYIDCEFISELRQVWGRPVFTGEMIRDSLRLYYAVKVLQAEGFRRLIVQNPATKQKLEITRPI